MGFVVGSEFLATGIVWLIMLLQNMKAEELNTSWESYRHISSLIALSILHWLPYRFSIQRKMGNTRPENAKVSSWPIFAPFVPIKDAMGPLYQATFIPRAAPRKPNANAPIAAQPNDNKAGLFQASKSYAFHLRRKMKCSSSTTVI